MYMVCVLIQTLKFCQSVWGSHPGTEIMIALNQPCCRMYRAKQVHDYLLLRFWKVWAMFCQKEESEKKIDQRKSSVLVPGFKKL